VISVTCVRGAGDKEASPISDEMLISDEMAIRRGTYEMNKQWYLVKSQMINAPYKTNDSGAELKDDDIIEISDVLSGISGNRVIRKISLSGTPSRVDMQISIAKHEDFI